MIIRQITSGLTELGVVEPSDPGNWRLTHVTSIAAPRTAASSRLSVGDPPNTLVVHYYFWEKAGEEDLTA